MGIKMFGWKDKLLCTMCKQAKAPNQFPIKEKFGTAHYGWCNSCKAEYWRGQNREYMRQLYMLREKEDAS